MFEKPTLAPEVMNPDGTYNSYTPEFHRLVENWTWGVTYGEEQQPKRALLAIESGPVEGVIVPSSQGPREEGVEPPPTPSEATPAYAAKVAKKRAPRKPPGARPAIELRKP